MDVHVEIAEECAVGVGKIPFYSPFEVLIDPSLHRDSRSPDYESIGRMEARAVTTKIKLGISKEVGLKTTAAISNERVVISPPGQQPRRAMPRCREAPAVSLTGDRARRRSRGDKRSWRLSRRVPA